MPQGHAQSASWVYALPVSSSIPEKDRGLACNMGHWVTLPRDFPRVEGSLGQSAPAGEVMSRKPRMFHFPTPAPGAPSPPNQSSQRPPSSPPAGQGQLSCVSPQACCPSLHTCPAGLQALSYSSSHCGGGGEQVQEILQTSFSRYCLLTLVKNKPHVSEKERVGGRSGG